MMILVFVILLAILVMYVLYGGFATLDCRVVDAPSETLIYIQYVGSYQQTPQLAQTMREVLRRKHGLELEREFAAYFDNPVHVRQNNLRAEIGWVTQQAITPELQQKISGDYHVKVIPSQRCIMVDYPYRDNFSLIMGAITVHSKLRQYAKQQGYSNTSSSIVQVRNIKDNKIEYRLYV